MTTTTTRPRDSARSLPRLLPHRPQSTPAPRRTTPRRRSRRFTFSARCVADFRVCSLAHPAPITIRSRPPRELESNWEEERAERGETIDEKVYQKSDDADGLTQPRQICWGVFAPTLAAWPEADKCDKRRRRIGGSWKEGRVSVHCQYPVGGRPHLRNGAMFPLRGEITSWVVVATYLCV